MKPLMIRIIAKIVLVCIFLMFVSILSTAFLPTFNNQMAMGQMTNDDFAFAAWEMWQSTYFNTIQIATTIAIGLTGIWIVSDVYKFFKKRKEM